MADWVQITLNNICANIEQFYTSHQIVNGNVFFGKESKMEASGALNYPFVRYYVSGCKNLGAALEMTIDFSVYDQQRSDDSNLKEVFSDTNQIFVDTTNFFKRNSGYIWVVESGSDAEPFENRTPTLCAGWDFQIVIKTLNNQSVCNIPGISPTEPVNYSYTNGGQSLTVFRYLNLTGGTLTGPLYGTSAYFNTTISGGTYYSGTTLLEDIIRNISSGSTGSGGIGGVTNGLNTYTGGTFNLTSVNVSGGSFSNVSATTLSGGSIFSGSTELGSLFSGLFGQSDITRVQPGLNITTGGTDNLPVINTVASPFFSTVQALSFSGASATTAEILITAYNPNTPAIRHSTSTGTGLMFDGPDILSIHTAGKQRLLINSTGKITDGAHTVDVGWGIDLTGLTKTRNGFSSTTISATTYYSGGTNLEQIIRNLEIDTQDITRVQPGLNITTGGTDNLPTINTVASPFFSTVQATSFSGGTGSFSNLSGVTIFSAGTNLSSIFLQSANYIPTGVAPGQNITTGNTFANPTISVAASPIFNNTQSVSFSGGTGTFSRVSATTYIESEVNNPNANSAQTIDVSLADNFSYTLTSNTVFTFSNFSNGNNVNVAVMQNLSTSAFTSTFTASTAIEWQNTVAPTQSPITGRTDIFSFKRVNSILYGVYAQNFG